MSCKHLFIVYHPIIYKTVKCIEQSDNGCWSVLGFKK